MKILKPFLYNIVLLTLSAVLVNCKSDKNENETPMKEVSTVGKTDF